MASKIFIKTRSYRGFIKVIKANNNKINQINKIKWSIRITQTIDEEKLIEIS